MVQRASGHAVATEEGIVVPHPAVGHVLKRSMLHRPLSHEADGLAAVILLWVS